MRKLARAQYAVLRRMLNGGRLALDVSQLRAEVTGGGMAVPLKVTARTVQGMLTQDLIERVSIAFPYEHYRETTLGRAAVDTFERRYK